MGRSFNRGRSVQAIGFRGKHETSLSARDPNFDSSFKANKNANTSTEASNQFTTLPSSKQHKKRAMQEAYGAGDKNFTKKLKKLNRASSRSSVRSTKSARTPLISRKQMLRSEVLEDKSELKTPQIGLMPSLKK